MPRGRSEKGGGRLNELTKYNSFNSSMKHFKILSHPSVFGRNAPSFRVYASSPFSLPRWLLDLGVFMVAGGWE